MKVGDIVCLSEYGIARDFNKAITNVDPYQVGVIVKEFSSDYPYKIHWMKTPASPYTFMVSSHSRRELKYAGR